MIKGNNIVREVIFMNKKFNKILFGFVAMFAFVGLAHAQDSASMKCNKTNLYAFYHYRINTYNDN